MDVITTDQLTKDYGSVRAVNSVDLRVPEASIYGFLGPNGSGKSTTMKMLLHLVRPTEGAIAIFGRPMEEKNRIDLLRNIGSLIETPSVYGHLTGAENMEIARRLLGLSPEQINRALALVRLSDQRHKQVRQYSLGMKQRLGIALALARSPRLLILDEPTNGLDPAGVEEIRELLMLLSGEGVTVMVSSHHLAEIERIATVLGVLNRGQLVFQGPRADLLSRTSADVMIETPDSELAQTALPGGRLISVREGIKIPNLSLDATAQVVAHLARHQVRIYGVRRLEQSLEDVFIALTGRGGEL